MNKKRLLTDKSGELQERYLEEAARKLAEDMDFEVLRGLLTESGWSEVVLRPMTWENGSSIDRWTQDNIKNGFYTRGLVWLFKDAKEANWFSLRWSS